MQAAFPVQKTHPNKNKNHQQFDMALEIFGPLATLAGLSMSFAHFMQAAKIWKTKSSKDLSLPMYFIFFIGSILWLAYGL